MTNNRGNNRKSALIPIAVVAGIVLAGIVFAIRASLAPTDQEYRFKTPPPGPNARPEGINREKQKRLPGPMAAPGGSEKKAGSGRETDTPPARSVNDAL
jgi:hypothetical protein